MIEISIEKIMKNAERRKNKRRIVEENKKGIEEKGIGQFDDRE